MPKGHKNHFEVNLRDDHAEYWFQHNLKVSLHRNFVALGL